MEKKFIRLVKDLESILDKYQLRFVGGTYDQDGNLRSIVISDDEVQRDESLGHICDENYGFSALIGNKFDEEDLH